MTLRGGVAAFRLPLPLDALSTIREAVERLYGTGETMMRPEGDRITIVAPAEGWGPRKRGRGALPSSANDQMRLKHIELRDGRASMTVEDTQYTVLLVSEISRQWFELVGGVNYVETKLSVDGGAEPEFIFTMQRVDGLSPADKAAAAEARVAELEEQILEMRGRCGC
ncbi:hypothetical protein SK224_08055 [Microbacterium sp. BG28]|uniref:hypothetical protein n=1 Tax=Microbacterium sp. BG28 TaxID=3097356 RepID=UPI002A59C2BC|nr:hypothetical protein [Microbacterium sp. BG28]MDY0829080.1 hypothetical protein [Microbacterium sp. BG28]